jgi:hypothetical protein
MVCKLEKALYGLKQAGCEWYKTLKEFFYKIGYSWCNIDHSIFYIHSEEAHVNVAIATDNMAVTGMLFSMIEDFKWKLSHHFDILDMGKIHWFLNFKIKWDRTAWKIFINQKVYIEAMVKRFDLQDSGPTYLPTQPSQVFSNIQSPSTPAVTTRLVVIGWWTMVARLIDENTWNGRDKRIESRGWGSDRLQASQRQD